MLSTTVSNGTKTTGKMSHSGGASLGRPGLLAAAAAAGGGGVGALEQLLEVSVLTHAEAVAPDVDDMAVVHEAVDQGAGHDVVAEDLAPILEAFVAREHGGGPLVAAAHELEEEHGAGACDREVAELVDDQERREDERLEPLAEPTRRLGFLERRDEIGEGAVVDAAATLGGGDREADREVGLPHTGRPEEDDVFFALDEAERVQAVELLAFDRRLEAEVEVGERLHGRQTRGAHGGGEPAGIAQRDLRPGEPAAIPELPHGRGGDAHGLPQAARRGSGPGRLEGGRHSVQDVPAHLLRGAAPNRGPGGASEHVYGRPRDGARRRGDGAEGVRAPGPGAPPRRGSGVPGRAAPR